MSQDGYDGYDWHIFVSMGMVTNHGIPFDRLIVTSGGTRIRVLYAIWSRREKRATVGGYQKNSRRNTNCKIYFLGKSTIKLRKSTSKFKRVIKALNLPWPSNIIKA